MNKTIIININGIIFHIEEEAYELLKAYMTEVKRHFYNSADSLEITTDIENRIAEMFTEILAREHRQVVTEQDVKIVTEQMGSVQDFDYEDTGAASSMYTDTTARRRLFRDPDDHLVSGVCAGIANYFDVETVWVRLLFAVFFAVGGSGLLLYIVLWIIVPKATSRADRMAMKGEPLDLQGFKRNFEAELSSVSGRLSAMHQEARPLIYKSRDFISDFFHHFGIFLGGAGKVLLKLLGIAVILACTGGIIGILVALIAGLVFNEYHFDLPINFFEYRYINQVYVVVSLVFILPLVGLIMLIARLVFNVGKFNSTIGYTLLMIWICAFVMLIYHGSRVATEFNESASFTQTINLKPTVNQTYYLKLNDVMFLTKEDSARLDIENRFKNMTLTDERDDENREPRSLDIDIVKADVDHPVLIENFTARGRDYDRALANARNTRYIFLQQDSVLKFDHKVRRNKHELWHNERVRLTLQIPLNATIVIDDPINNYISNAMGIYQCSVEINHQKDTGTAAFIMTDNGLECKTDSIVNTIQHKKDSVSALQPVQKTVK